MTRLIDRINSNFDKHPQVLRELSALKEDNRKMKYQRTCDSLLIDRLVKDNNTLQATLGMQAKTIQDLTKTNKELAEKLRRLERLQAITKR